MIPTVAVLMVTHAVEVMVWALVYWVFGAAPADADLVYFAFVNYTTLGYGDVVPLERWRLLGPITAMNGILLLGWSTKAIAFEFCCLATLGGAEISPIRLSGTQRAEGGARGASCSEQEPPYGHLRLAGAGVGAAVSGARNDRPPL